MTSEAPEIASKEEEQEIAHTEEEQANEPKPEQEEAPQAEQPPEPEKEEPKVEEDPKAHLTSTFFYDQDQIFQESAARSEFDTRYKLAHAYGFDLSRRYNAVPLNETTVVITNGNYAYFLDLVSGSEEIIPGHNEGIHCVAVHPNAEYVALGEAGANPCVLIYHYPSLKLYRILKGGTESAYSALNFSPDGKMLAAVGTFPDYTMTIWNWEKETLILRAKAFSQDIYRVTFSDKLAGRLTTGGVGHIRFWEMARTFTGLKLQGEIGKFGNIEISDTAGYAMLPDGKVLSGSESGSLLLWEDGLVKCEFDRQGGKKCHNGMVEVVFLNGHDIISAGKDGVIRIWDFTTIDTAETEDTSIPIDLTMKGKLRIAPGASIKCMHHIGTQWLIVDSSAGIWRADIHSKNVELLQKYHSGAVRAAAFSPNEPIFVTGGDDGYLRLWNIAQHTMDSEMHFECGITKILWAPLEVDKEGITLYVGFADGCMRVIMCTAKGLVLKQPVKPHTSSVRDIVVDTISNTVATTGDDGALFFFKIEQELVPIGFVYVNGKLPKTKEEITQAAISGVPLADDKEYAKGLKIRWSNNVVSVECSDGSVASVSPPVSRSDSEAESFYLDLKIDVLPGSSKDENITAVLACDEGDIIGKSDGSISTEIYTRKLHSAPITVIAATPDRSWMLTASENGEIFLFQQQQVTAREIKAVEFKEVEVAEVADIKAGDYSIEEEKQKSELDRRIKAADEKKELVKQKIDNMRQKYLALVQQNAKAPAYMRLDADAFKIDPFLYDIMQEKSDKLVKEASYGTMWAAEKSRVGLRKVKNRLIRNMTREAFTVRGIRSDVYVTSFRMTALDDEVANFVAESTTTVTESEEQDQLQDATTTHGTESVAGTEAETMASVQSQHSQTKRRRFGRFGQKAPMKKIVHTADEHTQMRRKRDERRKAIMDLKPPSNYSDPADLEAIEIAKRTIGDYKLKDDPTYIAPEEERMNATKKRRQLMLLQNAINEMKLNFNTKLDDLAKLKEDLVQSIEATNRELEEISLTIGNDPTEEMAIIPKKDELVPLLDLRDKIDVIIPSPEAISFAEQVAAAAKRRIEAQAGKQKQAQPQRRGAAATKRQQAQQAKRKHEEREKLSEVESIEQAQIRTQLEYRKKVLKRNIESGIARFDEKVAEIAEEKARVHSEIVLAELRFLMMLREFKLLSKLEMRDHDLNDKLHQRQSDMDAIDREVAEQQKKLKEAEHELEDAQKLLKKLARRFDAMVDPNLKCRDQLWTIYNYNIRKNAKRDEGDDVDIDFTTMDVEQVRKMLEAQAIQKQSDTCPADCDQALFDKILDLREERMDIIESNSGAQTIKDQAKHQCDSILKKRKNLETQFNQIKQEFDEFQHEKQRRLNELNFSLSLQFHQIRYMETKEVPIGESRTTQLVKQMPTDLSQALVFLESGLEGLKQQEQNLKNNRQTLYNLYRSNCGKQNEDEKEKAKLMKEIANMTSKLYEIQKLKFGQNVDLVMLEQLRVNKDADALREQIAKVEKVQHAEMQEITDQINQATDDLTREVQRNTAVLGSLATLTEQQRDIESELQNSRTTQTADDLNQDLGLDNPDDLLAEVEKNNAIIDQLNEEIGLLKRH